MEIVTADTENNLITCKNKEDCLGRPMRTYYNLINNAGKKVFKKKRVVTRTFVILKFRHFLLVCMFHIRDFKSSTNYLRGQTLRIAYGVKSSLFKNCWDKINQLQHFIKICLATEMFDVYTFNIALQILMKIVTQINSVWYKCW